MAPLTLRDEIIAEIERTIEAHREGRPARIAMKMNALVDKRCIRALYRASQAGVPVDLNVRGICSLRPGVEGVSQNIRVVSVVGRFLEHSRIFAFQRDEAWRVLIGSADLMPRNLDTRVELVAPVEDDVLRDDLLDTLERCFADTTNAWDLDADGTWTRRAAGARAALGPGGADGRPRRPRERAGACLGRRAAASGCGRRECGPGHRGSLAAVRPGSWRVGAIGARASSARTSSRRRRPRAEAGLSRRDAAGGAGARQPARRAYQCTPLRRFAIATCSIDAFSSGSFLPFAAAESGNTL